MRIAALMLLVALGAPAIRAQAEMPPNEGWVTDLAGFLQPQQERALEALMQSYEEGSGNEIALLTVPDLGGTPIERYALEVGRAWRIGKAERNNAALLLVARQERKIRIEVGRGLEGTLTDSISGRIIRDVITPEFKRARYYEGLRAGIEAMHAAAGGDYAALPAPRGRGSGNSGVSGLVPLLFWVVLFLVLSRGGRGGCLLPWLAMSTMGRRRSAGWHGGFGGGGGRGGGFGGGGFGGFGGGGGFSGGGASGGW